VIVTAYNALVQRLVRGFQDYNFYARVGSGGRILMMDSYELSKMVTRAAHWIGDDAEREAAVYTTLELGGIEAMRALIGS
jgi:hypothetical protein